MTTTITFERATNGGYFIIVNGRRNGSVTRVATEHWRAQRFVNGRFVRVVGNNREEAAQRLVEQLGL